MADVLDQYPEAEDKPGSPGRVLRRRLEQGGFVAPDGRLRLPADRIPEAEEPDVEGIWKPDRLRIFMSHVHAVRTDVTNVATLLESLQCSCFVAHVQIEPSRDWQDVIETALRTCHVLVAYVTPEFPRSDWTDQEVGWALGRGVPVIPVNAGHQPYGFFGSVQSLPAGSTQWGTARSLFRAIAISRFRGQTPPGFVNASLVARTIVRAFCESGSYESTRRRFEFLELIPPAHWTDEMREQLLEAIDNNDQIYDAGLRTRPRRSAPEGVRELLARVGRMPRPRRDRR